MNMNLLKSTICLLTMSMLLSGAATACTIGETAALYFPFNTTTLSNTDRVAIANKVIEAKRWPNVEIRAIVIAGAYFQERNIEKLKDIRAINMKDYLLQLGINAENIYIDKRTFTDEVASKRPDGSIDIQQVIVEFTPICKGSCAWMCDDPRVTPHSRLINNY
ncbi:hypothetical protein [Burkholderia catarinensis]|uniref:hypothetical protein n=1 Tax=Burkholderia catarinensis TaxID=1108140 RepID=UPI001FE2A120|nr:hypothetical protein [Burkholderia catarinensis]